MSKPILHSHIMFAVRHRIRLRIPHCRLMLCPLARIRIRLLLLHDIPILLLFVLFCFHLYSSSSSYV